MTSSFIKCRDDKIRTCDLYVPNVARYQLRHIPFTFCGCKFTAFLLKTKQ